MMDVSSSKYIKRTKSQTLPRRINGFNKIQKQLRVAIFVESFYPFVSGVARRFEELIINLITAGHLVCLMTGDEATREWFQNDPLVRTNVQFAIFPSYNAETRTKNSLKFIIPTLALYRTLTDFKPDVVHLCEQTPSSCLCFVLARYLRLPIVWSSHSDVVSYIHRFIYPPLVGRIASFLFCFLRFILLNRADHLLTVSEYFKNHLIDGWIVLRPVTVWHTGVSFDVFNPERRSDQFRRLMFGDNYQENVDRRLLLTVGRISPEKKLEFLAKIVHECDDVFLCVVGNGSYMDDARKLFPKSRTHFMGFLNGAELATAYASADFCVFASESETLGQVYLESMACGTPILAPRTPQMKEFFVDRKHGFLWEPSDFESAMSVVREAKNREPFGSKAAQYVRKHRSWALAAKQSIQIYEKVIELKKERESKEGFVGYALSRIESTAYALVYAITIVVSFTTIGVFFNRNL